MSTRTQRRPGVIAGAVVGLLLLSLMLPQTGTAQPTAVTCAAGYALWANGQTRDDTLVISGSNSTVTGAAHSNADFRISGSKNRITGAVEYVTRFEDGGDSNTYPPPARVAVAQPPVAYRIADYQLGGSAAAAALSVGRYHRIDGDLDVSDETVLDGLYYVTGNAKLSASDLRGTFTIVAEGAIDVSGSNMSASAYSGGLLLFSNKREIGASVIKIGGSNSQLRGVIYGPGGTAELAGSANNIFGLVVGDALKLSGSSLNIAFAAEHCPVPPGPPPPSEGYAPDEVVVKLFNAGDVQSVARDNGLALDPIDQFGTRPIFLMRILGGVDPLVKAEQLRPAGGSGGDPRVEYAEPNFLAQTPEGRAGRGSWVIGEDEGGYTEQWADVTLRLEAAHAGSRGLGVTVAVLDTGVDLDHPMLARRLVAGYDFVNDDDDPREEGVRGTNEGFGHGTHVAGLVALAAPDADIMPVRVLDQDGVGNIWVLSEGLVFAAERGAKVVNLSLGTTRRTSLLEEIIAEVACLDDDDDDDDDDRCAPTGGVVVVAAAGNGGDSVPQYPAAEVVAGSLAVGATNREDALAAFSTFGPWVRLAAPGDEIISTVPGGGYGTWSGTSMAAPFAAGAAALLRSAQPTLGAAAVIDRLVATGRAICGPIPSRLDPAAALGAPAAPGAVCSLSHRIPLPSVTSG